MFKDLFKGAVFFRPIISKLYLQFYLCIQQQCPENDRSCILHNRRSLGERHTFNAIFKTKLVANSFAKKTLAAEARSIKTNLQIQIYLSRVLWMTPKSNTSEQQLQIGVCGVILCLIDQTKTKSCFHIYLSLLSRLLWITPKKVT